MAGVVVWAYMNNRNLWSPYEPAVCCELEKLYLGGTVQANMGLFSQTLAGYDVNFTLMKQISNSGSQRDIKRTVQGPLSALGKGVVWEFEGDHSSQWLMYDLDTMGLLEDHFAKRNQTGLSVYDLQQSHHRLPYVIDFSNMTQMRVGTGRIRQIRRHFLNPNYPPATTAQGFGFSTATSGYPGLMPQKSVSSRSQQRHHPYTRAKSGATCQLGAYNGVNSLVGLSANAQQQLPQAPAPPTAPPQQPAAAAGYSNSQQQKVVHNTHVPYHTFSGLLSGMWPITTLTQALTPAPAHQNTAQSSSSHSQGSEMLPTVTKVTISKSKKAKSKPGVQALEAYMRPITADLDKSDCSICFDKLSEASSYGEGKADAHQAVELIRCSHRYHKLCLLEMHNSVHKDGCLQCPSCKTIYGEKTGICPPGFMQWRIVHDLPLPGYERYPTIIVTYHISSGVQGPEHPNPGKHYSARGFPRQGFLPDCDKGRKVLKLLMEAFRRRLMFTIATSHTTGEPNTVTWNEIHHKTEPTGNDTGHGYPDPNYLDNVLMELAAHGVTEDCLT